MGKILSRDYAMRLVKFGRAEEVAAVNQYGQTYIVLARWDIGRDDHYLASPKDVERVEIARAVKEDTWGPNTWIAPVTQ